MLGILPANYCGFCLNLIWLWVLLLMKFDMYLVSPTAETPVEFKDDILCWFSYSMFIKEMPVDILDILFNSLAPGRFVQKIKWVIFRLILVIDAELDLGKFPSGECHWTFSNEKLALVQVMAWCHQATSHYLSQCWPKSMSLYGITRPQWVNYLYRYANGVATVQRANVSRMMATVTKTTSVAALSVPLRYQTSVWSDTAKPQIVTNARRQILASGLCSLRDQVSGMT